jgi:hydroxymethylpyrimidine pyrophosphatase-like HAD family hydrolase
METKDQLVKTIKEWVKIDNEIRALQKEVLKRKTDKKKASSDLMGVMKKNEIDCFDINDGQIYYSKKNIKKPITKKVLMNTLSKFYKGDIEKASELNNFINENREEIVKETIERKIIIEKNKSNI